MQRWCWGTEYRSAVCSLVVGVALRHSRSLQPRKQKNSEATRLILLDENNIKNLFVQGNLDKEKNQKDKQQHKGNTESHSPSVHHPLTRRSTSSPLTSQHLIYSQKSSSVSVWTNPQKKLFHFLSTFEFVLNRQTHKNKNEQQKTRNVKQQQQQQQ